MPMISLAAIILYVVLLNFIGFIISTILFLYGISFLLGQKKQLNAILFTIVTTGVFIVLFSVLLEIPLPRGLGIFRNSAYFSIKNKGG
ncbi:tripartite tricarboxylate transporter TctB family protein [Bacillus sp. N9]